MDRLIFLCFMRYTRICAFALRSGLCTCDCVNVKVNVHSSDKYITLRTTTNYNFTMQSYL